MIVQGLIIQGEGSTILIESQHTPTDEAASTSVDDRLTRDVYGAAFTKLIKKVKKLKQKVKSSQATKRSKVIIFEEESSDSDIFAQEDPSKQGRNLSKIDEDLDISLKLQEELKKNAKLKWKREENLRREQEEEASQAVLMEEWDDRQAQMDADYELAERLQQDKRAELSIEERSKLIVELINERKRYLQGSVQRSKKENHQPRLKEEIR
nr:hypothetical protein [Tanacetum cinerariifolium]